MPIPPYVEGLRTRVGHDLLWLPGVSGVVVDDAGRLLLGRRADTGSWAIVSGILDPGEEPAAGLAREVLEETGVRVTVEALTAVSVTPPVDYPNGDRSQFVDLCFVCRPVSREAAAAAHVADDESLDVAWFAPDDLPADLMASSRERVDRTFAYLAAPSAGPWFAS